MIEVKNLTKIYGNHKAVDSLDFKVEEGHIYGFLGPNGAGKTTTMNMITGCLSPSDGDVFVCGQNILTRPVAAKANIGYLPEIPPLYTDMTPREYLTFVAEAKGIKKSTVKNAVEAVIDVTKITERADRLIKFLSKGYRQRVGIAQAMLGDPSILIFDEPTVGLDPKQIIEIRRLIKSLGKDNTVIISSHILSEIEEICDYIIIMNQGKIVANDTLESLKRDYAGYNILSVESRSDYDSVMNVLKSLDGVISIRDDKETAEQGGIITYTLGVDKKCDVRDTLFSLFVKNGLTLVGLTHKVITLEDIFLSATGGEDVFEEYEDEDTETDDFDGNESLSEEEEAKKAENPSLISLDALKKRALKNKREGADDYDEDYDYDDKEDKN